MNKNIFKKILGGVIIVMALAAIIFVASQILAQKWDWLIVIIPAVGIAIAGIMLVVDYKFSDAMESIKDVLGF
ncbi:MAG TPA: hypothetical protein VLA77_04280 [Candidatus Saccharimonadales bacterium]|nr:hypothetical protein [Candidatus Saccharimonadales bacterium]